MRISMIAALDRKNVIGCNGDLPWRLKKDMRHFKSTTSGKPIIMGRKTFESIGRALPGRKNIILTRNKNYHADGVTVVHSKDAALEATKNYEEVVIIGGGDIYELFLDIAQVLYLTFVDADTEGDTFFPEIDETRWTRTSRISNSADKYNEYDFEWVTLERIPVDELGANALFRPRVLVPA